MPVRRAVTAASRRNAAQYRLLTAAPVSLERLHLCRMLTDREIFDSAKTENRSTARF
jgi:hypothetical protein